MAMKSKTRLIVWLSLIYLIFLILAIVLFQKKSPWLLIGSEIIIPVLFGITLLLINRSHQPIQTISKSMSLLREGDFSTTLVRSGNPDVDAIVDVYNAMINRLREERLSVREKNQFLDLLMESSPLGIIVVDFDDKIMDINRAAFKSLDVLPGDFRGCGLADLNSPLAGKLLNLEFGDKKTLDRADGQKFLCRKLFFMDHGFKHPFYIIEEFSEEIRQAEKTAYGKLIRMMAHEVNNTVGAVNSILSTILDNEKSFVTDDQEEVIQMLGVAVQRNYRLNRFMQNFSDVVKLPMPEKDEYDLNLSMKNVILSLTPVLNESNIRIETEFEEPSPRLFADQSQMEQVFLNIIKNSIEAVGPKGHIHITTFSAPVRIVVSDNGQGLSAESRERLFTPFYSTKIDGQGIGLTLVREILVNHGFQYRLANREAGGAEFEIISSRQ